MRCKLGVLDSKLLVQLSVALPPDDPCVDLVLYGIDGSALFETRRCEPDRCVVFHNIGSSLCVETPHADIDVARVSEASCDDPPVLEYEGDEIVYPGSPASRDGGTDSGRDADMHMRTRRATSCQLLPLSAARRLSSPLVLLSLAGLFLLWRRLVASSKASDT